MWEGNLVRVHPDSIEQVSPVEEDRPILDTASIAIRQHQGGNVHLKDGRLVWIEEKSLTPSSTR